VVLQFKLSIDYQNKNIIKYLTSQDGYTVPAQQPAHVEPSFFVSHIRVVEEPISQSAELTYSNMINTTMDQTTFVDNSSAASVRLIKNPLYYEAQKKKILLNYLMLLL